MKQTDIIMQALREKRTVSMLTATHMNIGNLRDVIMKLRDMGHGIECIRDTDAEGRRFAKYVLTYETPNPVAPTRHVYAPYYPHYTNY